MALSKAADELRLKVLRMGHEAGSGHMGGSLSCVEILHTLYGRIMNVDPQKPDWPQRDRFVLSKGHAAPILYAVLSARGFFPEELLWTLRDLGSPLQGHPCMFKLSGIDMSTGSLGLGLSCALGMALTIRMDKSSAHVYALLGDGELQEGQNWEAFMALCSFGVANLTPIIDLNGVQLDGRTEEIQPHQSRMSDKLEGFGLRVFQADGHDEEQLFRAIMEAARCGVPHAVIAHTVKGKGVSYMEGQAAWHGKPMSDADYKAAKAQIEGRLLS